MNRVGRQLAALEGHEDPGREHRVEERVGVADQAEAVAGGGVGAVAELAGDPHRPAVDARLEVLADPLALGCLAPEDGLRVAHAPVAVQVVALGHDADADGVVDQGDVPEPALVGYVGHGRGARVEPGVAQGAGEVGEDGDLVQVGVAPLPPQAAGQQGVAPGGVDDHAGPPLGGAAVGQGRAHPDRPAVLRQDLADRHPLADLGPLLGRVPQHHGVEVRPQNLPRARALVLDGLEEVERLRHLAVRRHELHAVLHGAARLLQPVEHPQALEGEPRIGHQRFADVVAGEPLALEQQHPPPVPGQDGAGGGAGRPAADDDRVPGRFRGRGRVRCSGG